MVRIELETQQLELLMELVNDELEQLRSELRRTENHAFRERLHKRQAALNSLSNRLQELSVSTAV